MAVLESELGVVRPTAERAIGAIRPRLGELAINSFAYYADPPFERVREAVTFGSKPEPGFDFTKHIPPEHKRFASRYAYATNKEHAAEITRVINESLDRRALSDDASIGQLLMAEFANPINFVGIPIGAPAVSAGRVALSKTIVRGDRPTVEGGRFSQTIFRFNEPAVSAGRVSFGKTMARGGAAVGLTEFGLSVGAQVSDPVQTYTETAMNVAMAATFGAGITGAFSVPTDRTLRALDATRAQTEAIIRTGQRINEIGGVSDDAMARMLPRDQRPLGADDTVEATAIRIRTDIEQLEAELAAVPAGSGEERIIRDRIDELRAQRQPYADELLYRTLDAEGFNAGDMYRPSKGVENALFAFVTSPFRRALTGNFGAANNPVKDAFVRLAGDAGTQLHMNEFGIRTPLSVHQASARDMGEFAVAYEGMVRLWAEDTSAVMPDGSLLSGFDINATSLARTIQRQGDSITSWLSDVSRRRSMGEEMTQPQRKAAQMMDDYFNRWEARLLETGQLRTRETLSREVNDLRTEVEALRIKVNEGDTASANRLAERESALAQAEVHLADPTLNAKAEPFFPRFWNQSAIKKNRDAFKRILETWYSENPYIIRFNQENMAWERVDLDPTPEAISRRADETIDSILGDSPTPEDFSQVFTGRGRPSAIQSRSLNIPNSRVFDFIEQNPVNVMAAYTARTSSKYNFAKSFGANFETVKARLRAQMADAGNSEEAINKAMVDFTHLYDRVVGRVVRDPLAWNQQAASILRDMAGMTYLGRAGIAAFADFGRIIMENTGENLGRTAQAFLDPALRRASIEETRALGGALEMLLGSAHMRMVDDQNWNPLNNGVMDRVKNTFHTLNLLGPVTVMAKEFAGAAGAHMIIEMSQRLARGAATDFDVRYLARYGIDADIAKRIADAPYQVDSRTGFILPNSAAWAGNYKIPEVDGGRVRIVEANEDGSSVGKTNAKGEYVYAYYRPNEGGDGGTIYFDREFAETTAFEEKRWTKSRMEGVRPYPEDTFKTPREWSNFVMWHEIMHTRFSAEDLGLPPKSAAYENRINELAMVEHKASQKVAQETADIFKAAVNNHTANMVLMATAADKPIMMDGIVYVPESMGRMFGLEPDPRNPGYARVENAFIGLPLQFFSYSLANVNKTVGLMMQGAVRSRVTGIASMLGLGYMVTWLRTPDFVWDQMSPQDKMARAFDMGGVAALYSDLFYTALQTSLALGGPNITGGFISPRFPQEPNALDAMTNVGGAASSWVTDMGRSAHSFASGEYGEGASQFVRNLPFSNLWFLRNEVNELGRYLSRM